MKLFKNSPPHIRMKDSNTTLMLDAIAALIPVYALAVYYYGARALMLAAYSVATCYILDKFCVMLSGKKQSMRDLSPVITGLIIVLFMPASVPVTTVIVACVFAIIVTKHPFGGLGENIFNPAAAGVGFTIICYPTEMFAYPAPLIHLPLENVVTARTVQSTINTLKLGGIPGVPFTDMLFGNFAGAMGSTCILVLISCFVYLFTRRATNFYMTGSYILACALIAAFFPRNSMTMYQSLAYELMGGTLLLGGVFLLNDPVTSPKRNLSKFIYGFATGITVMLFRHYGKYNDGVVFAILFSNSFVWMMDVLSEYIVKMQRRRRYLNETRQV